MTRFDMTKDDEKAILEAAKLFFDTMKHLTTLSVASILILIGLLEKVFTHPRWRAVLALSFAAFFFSIMAATRIMVFLSGHVARKGYSQVPTGIYRFMAFSFVAGIFCLVIFVLRNLFA